MTEAQFKAWCRTLGYPDATQTLIRRIRDGEPSRRVQGGNHNLHGAFPSQKIGLTVQFESRTQELMTLWKLENDDHVLEYYDQPESIVLQYRSSTGRQVTVHHTPDLFVLWDTRAGWLECKPTERLQELTEIMPERYVATDQGWTCPPGEACAQPFGLTYQLITDANLDITYLRNQQFLADYRHTTDQELKPTARTAILTTIGQQPGLALARLLEIIQPEATADDVYRLVVREELYIDLHHVPLAEPHRVAVFPNATWAAATEGVPISGNQQRVTVSLVSWEVGQTVSWSGVPWTVLNIGGGQVFLQHTTSRKLIALPVTALEDLVQKGSITGIPVDTRGPLSPSLLHATPAAIAEATKKWKRLTEAMQPSQHLAPRTRQRWARKVRIAEASGQLAITGLIPQYALRGNRTPRISEAHEHVLQKAIQTYYEAANQPSIRAAWLVYTNDAENAGFHRVSYPTFVSRVHNRPRTHQVKERRGKRAAYDEGPRFWYLDPTTPVHGERPYHVFHIDHTELDLVGVSEDTGDPLGRPWLSLITDAYDRMMPAFYLTYQSPSTISTMTLLRLMVQQHHRFPEQIVVDQGADFQSCGFDVLLAAMRCTKLVRPAAEARFGSPMERLFGVTNSQFIDLLTGNTQSTKFPRQMTRSHDPKRRAVWTLAMLYEAFEAFITGYHNRVHSGLGTSPNNRHNRGMAQFGERPMRHVPYDMDFVLLTHPTTEKGTAKIQRGRGLKILYHYFWSPAFVRPGVEGSTVPVRYDPLDSSKAWAFVGGQWEVCQGSSVFAGRSEWELRVAAEEIRQQDRRAHASSVNERALREWILKVQTSDRLAQQRQRDRELHRPQMLAPAPAVSREPSTTNRNLSDVPLVDYGEVE